ncbi:MAG: alcohol dehydrogenase catalytic domain-containing protein, partial [Armatimonadota bacterium]
MSNYDSFVDGTADIPDINVTWPLYGTGLESLGKNKQPVEWAMPEIGPDELLARVDACGLCFSDIKVLRLGPDHPRISGRDLKKDPVILGHEVALTIVKVGEERADDFTVGDRFVVQADIYYNGEGLAFGYALHGGLEQYVKIPTPILDGDDGCYLIPIPDDIGYSEAALAEPWACVVCAFRVETRKQLADGGTVAIVGDPDAREGFMLGELDAAAPDVVIALNAPEDLVAQFEGAVCIDVDDEEELARVAEEKCGGIDDLIMLDPTADQVESLATLL